MADTPNNNVQVYIDSNGTTTLATAGKYCDANVDLNVNVPPQPLPFTNLYDPANVVIDKRCSFSSTGLTVDDDTACNYIKIPYHRKPGTPFVIRMRGIQTQRDRYSWGGCNANGNFIRWGQASSEFVTSYDEYGDAVWTFKYPDTDYEWVDFYITFQYPGCTSVSAALTGPIITINEPIGSGVS